MALFTSESEIGDETILEGFNRGEIVALNICSKDSMRAKMYTLPGQSDTFLVNAVSEPIFELNHGTRSRRGEKEPIRR